MIHNSIIQTIIEKKKANGKPKEFSIKFVKKSTGEIVIGDRCICLSSHFDPRTYNIKFVESGAIRKIKHISIIELNGEEVYE